MAQKKDEDTIIDIEDTLSKSEEFLKKNQRPLTIGAVVLVALVGGFYYYFGMYLPPLEQDAQREMFKAQQYFEADSFQLAMYGDVVGNMGFEEIVDAYGSTKAGNLAKYYMGVSLLQTGDFEGAISYLKSYSPKDVMTASISQGAIGDALSELGDYEGALSQYEKAATSSANDMTSPIYLFKAGMMAERLQDYATALKHYKSIQKEYPLSQEARAIDKYIARAEAYNG